MLAMECRSSYHLSGSDLRSAYNIAGAIDIALGQGAAGVFTNSPTMWHCIFQVGTIVCFVCCITKTAKQHYVWVIDQV